LALQINASDTFQGDHWYTQHISLITAFGFPFSDVLEESKRDNHTETW
jgi:hypothetical protein